MSSSLVAVSELYVPRIAEVIKEKLGHELPLRRIHQIAETIGTLATESGHSDLDEYLDLVQRLPVNAPLVQSLIKAVTNKESYFFRDEPAMVTLRSKILPELIERNRGSRVLRVWSAGCSTGEEIYTISILLQELLDDYDSWTISLVATDVDEAAVAFARRAEYKPWSLRTTPAEIRHRYFHHDPVKNVFPLRKRFRKNVSFGFHNLADPNANVPSPGTFDLIFCRNVLIYFDRDAQQIVSDKFAQVLSSDGAWIGGPSDPLPRRGFRTRIQTGLVLHERQTGQVRAEPAVSSALPFESWEKPRVDLSLLLPRSWPKREEPATKRAAEEPPLIRSSEERTSAPPSASDVTALLDAGSIVPSGSYSTFEIKLEIASNLANQGALDEAERIVSELRLEHPLRAETYVLRANIQLARGHNDAAIAELKRAIYLDPAHINSHFLLGSLTLANKDNEAALRAFRTTTLLVSAIEAPTPEQRDFREFAASQIVRLLHEERSWL